MIFKGTPNTALIIKKRRPMSFRVSTHIILSFDSKGLIETEDEYIIKKLLENGYKDVKPKSKETIDDKPKTNVRKNTGRKKVDK